MGIGDEIVPAFTILHYSILPLSLAATPERFLLAGFAVCGGGSVVAADDWQEFLHTLSKSSPHN